jgi:UPF0271 protein
MMAIDLNCDMGESPELLADGTQDALLRWVTSVNVACGAHAGDPALMRATILAAKQHGVRVGAHPGYPDRANFGRVALPMSSQELAESVENQLRSLADAASECGVVLSHGKAHGALYNRAAADEQIAAAIAEGFHRTKLHVPLFGLAGSVMLRVFQECGFATVAEAFVDRRYESDGALRDRRHPDALIALPEEAAAQAISIARDGFVRSIAGARVSLTADTLCVHSDSPGAALIARSVRMALEQAGIAVRPISTVSPPERKAPAQ